MGPIGCVDGETEFYSQNGWKRIDEYEDGDSLLVYGDYLFYEKPAAYINKPCDVMYHFTGQVDMVLSPEHKVLLCDVNGALTVDTAENLRNGPGFGVPGVMPGHSLTSLSRLTVDNVETVHRDRKYCFTTSTGFWLARRNGTVFITGNSGKSVACCIEIVNIAYRQRPDRDGKRRTRWAIIRNSYPELKSTTIKTWQEWFSHTVCPIKWDAPITGRMFHKLHDGTEMELEVLFLSLDRPADVKKVLSLELTGAWINEAREMQKVVVDAIISRTGRFPAKRDFDCPDDVAEEDFRPITWSGAIMDTNPPDEDHWWYQAAELGGIIDESTGRMSAMNGWEFFRQPGALLRIGEGYKPNPQAENVNNHALGYDYWLRQTSGKSKKWIDVYLLGEYGTLVSGKPVFERDWNEALHIADLKPVEGIDLLVGLDFGLTPAAVICQYVNGLRVIDEVCESNIGFIRFMTERLLPLLATKYRGYVVTLIGDPAGSHRKETDESSVFIEAQKLGWPIQAAPSNLLNPRLEAVRYWMTKLDGGKPMLQVNRGCKMVRQGFAGKYRYDQINTTGIEARYHPEPVKNAWSHPMDALQYVALFLKEGGNAMKPITIRHQPQIYDSAVGY